MFTQDFSKDVICLRLINQTHTLSNSDHNFIKKLISLTFRMNLLQGTLDCTNLE